MLITFSGLDGAGKSTLIESLKTSLEQRNQQVAIFHMEHQLGLYAYLKSIRDAFTSIGRNAGKQPQQKMDCSTPCEPRKASEFKLTILRGSYRIVWNKPLRRCVYLLDLFIFLFYRLYIEKIKKQILIMDRYFYDRLVDVAGEQKSWWVIKFLALLTPTPSLPVFLDVSPEEAYARKREFSVEYLRSRQASYHRVFPWIRTSVVVASGPDVSATALALEQMVIERTRVS